MKTLFNLLAAGAITILTIGAVTLVLLESPQRASPVWIAALGIGIALMTLPAVIRGATAAYFDADVSQRSRRYFRVLSMVAFACAALGAVIVAVFCAVTGTPWWVAALFVSVAGALLLVAPPVGNWLRRWDAGHPSRRERLSEAGIRPGYIRTRVLAMAAVGVGIFAVAVALFALTDLLGSATLVFAASAGFLAASIAGLLATLPLSRSMRSLARGDIGTLRGYARVVLSSKDDPVQDTDSGELVRYARLASVQLSFTLGYIGCLYASLVCNQLATLVDGGEPDPFRVGFIAVICLTFVVLGALMVVRIRRARRYADDNSDAQEPSGYPLPEPNSPAAADPKRRGESA